MYNLYKGKYGFLYNEDNYVNVWVDGSCLGNGRPNARAGYGVFYNYRHHMNVSAPVKGRATNNVGEIQAAIRAIQDCEDVGVTLLQINTDSHFLCDAVKKCMPRWSQNGFLKADGSPLANQDEFMELDQLMSESNMHVVFKHVRAHNNDPYNDAADELAKAGAAKYRR